jgi:spore coat polysaccharide biosynthesis protein SpsF
MTRVVAIVQARIGSTRLPGKVLRELAGRPMVLRVVERARRIARVDAVVVAIPDLQQDDALARLLEDAAIPLVRGPGDDVLHRYVLAARATDADVVVRITADCPLLSPIVSGQVVAAFLEHRPDYASNTLERSWPRGLDTEVVEHSTLEGLDAEPRSVAEREHVTTAIWQHPERYRLWSVRGGQDLGALRWTVDTEDDFRLAAEIYREMADPEGFDVGDILALIERRPELRTWNAHVEQKPAQT